MSPVRDKVGDGVVRDNHGDIAIESLRKTGFAKADAGDKPNLPSKAVAGMVSPRLEIG
jgi:hypothetical protein